MKPHIKVIQRNGVDIFVTSSMTMKETKPNAHSLFNGREFIDYGGNLGKVSGSATGSINYGGVIGAAGISI
jgi:hypothetical protein